MKDVYELSKEYMQTLVQIDEMLVKLYDKRRELHSEVSRLRSLWLFYKTEESKQKFKNGEKQEEELRIGIIRLEFKAKSMRNHISRYPICRHITGIHRKPICIYYCISLN